jgi:alpha-L-fucosidase
MDEAEEPAGASTAPPLVTPRSTPEWYKNAKFGIFIHWGPPSVPAWAPQTTLNTQQMIKEKGLTYYFKNNPYAEWYFNTMRVPGSPTQQYHQEQWKGASYDVFGEIFNTDSAADNYEYFATWADLFSRAGARYVVPVSKHHDGFTLWPTRVPPRKENWSAPVDLIGKLRTEVLARNMKMGVYYSGLYDWTWNGTGIRNGFTAAVNGYQSPETVAYMDGHVRELIALYQPSVLWNDVGYVTHPSFDPLKLSDLWATYYAAVPNGAIDDRWFEIPASTDIAYAFLTLVSQYFAQPGAEEVSDWIDGYLKKHYPSYDKPPGGLTFPISTTYDFRTYEYEVPDDIKADKWELVRGIGLSFCYNRNELPSQWLTFPDLAWMFVDVVSKNGNLLLNVGPKSDGSLQDHEVSLLEAFGAWLKTYGGALYDSTPWSALPPKAYVNVPGLATIRFTEKNGNLNLLFKSPPSWDELFVPSIQPVDNAAIEFWRGPNDRIKLGWRSETGGIRLTLPPDLSGIAESPLQCVSINPIPAWSTG